MTQINIPADGLQIGDVILHAAGETEVRALTRNGHTITTNPGADDQITGQVWQHVEARRGGQG
ncbi:hypothetical protein [Streptomyces sp. NPDC058653]|uniref:hypothetical protein n=1 Tax=Streptomyces sp. NPDC058653 TaxID=3346576 RepID=UPI00365A8DFB